ncbi:MAG: RsmF rRNA methyltransferase first C-terminal domain-containing protein [Oscillospiraceae bacterium]|nr:RsmF rRNA methyltransferase first C-terminal domain-containing protein [Oscillospiraceae bacterium]
MPTEYFEARERALLGERYEALYAAPSEKPARGVTVNRLRMTREEFCARVEFAVEPSPFCSMGLLVPDPTVKLGRHPYHHAGAFYSQEPSASAPAELLDVRPGHKVLDLCAAPGGKSSQLAAALGGEGLLVSNEYDSGRAVILRQNLERMGVPNALVLNETPERIAKALPGYFDRVLVDAPCSGEGMFRKEPQAMAQHNQGLVEHCAELGREILDAAAVCLTEGGLLVYSTCTFAPEEDEMQVGAFLERHPEFELLDCGVEYGCAGEKNRCGEFQYAVEKTRRIWPCNGGEGHFMARLRKNSRGEGEKDARLKPQKPAKTCKEWYAFAKQSFPTLAEMPVTLLDDMVLLAPPELPALKLHILRAGVLAGSVQKGRFVPAHHLFTAFGAQCTNREELTLNDERLAGWLRGEEIDAHAAQNGWCCVTVDGLPLGGGKVSGGRVKNHLPKALRNLG